jgi:hypothetical protein
LHSEHNFSRLYRGAADLRLLTNAISSSGETGGSDRSRKPQPANQPPWWNPRTNKAAATDAAA